MQRLEVSCAVRRIYMSLGAKGLKQTHQRTDGRTDMTKLMGDFHDYGIAPKMAGMCDHG